MGLLCSVCYCCSALLGSRGLCRMAGKTARRGIWFYLVGTGCILQFYCCHVGGEPYRKQKFREPILHCICSINDSLFIQPEYLSYRMRCSPRNCPKQKQQPHIPDTHKHNRIFHTDKYRNKPCDNDLYP